MKKSAKTACNARETCYHSSQKKNGALGSADAKVTKGAFSAILRHSYHYACEKKLRSCIFLLEKVNFFTFTTIMQSFLFAIRLWVS
ncbi:hypothetical protein MITSMUL_04494 [Mitsuokella multacida DSM 20544]|uniref:Uncharacterized protein n=1 Tax=Mitsuokella multacida DSM 20544 TaxID=500635 RepID=C9KMQ6_9FIRM|nr:hypothetical protein MITSMUL_04494 [Mitsuokella multacida DSM 20544]